MVQKLQEIAAPGLASTHPAARERAVGGRGPLNPSLFLRLSISSCPQPVRSAVFPLQPQLPQPSPGRAGGWCVCVCVGRGVGGWGVRMGEQGGRLGSGIPHGKAAQSLPRPVRDPEPKQEAGRPWPGSGPSPDFPSGWGCNDSSPSPFPQFPCLHFSSRPRGGRCSLSPRQPGHPGPAAPAHIPGLLLPPGFLRAPARARSAYPSRDSTPAGPLPYALPYSKARRLLPAPSARPGGEGGGQHRGCDSSRPDQCQLQPCFSAPCQLALSTGTEAKSRGSLSLGEGGLPPPKPPALYPPKRSFSTQLCLWLFW